MSKRNYKANWALHGLTKKPLKPGDVVSLSDEEAEPYVGGVLSPCEDEPTTDPSSPAAPYEKLTKAQLVEAATARGIATDGTKADLIAKLEAADKAPPSE